MDGDEVGDVDKLLQAAISKGDVKRFEELLKEDPYVVDRVSFACSNRSPLHVAAMVGNADMVASILRRNSHLILKLDSQKSSALHMAAAQGHTEIASMLLSREMEPSNSMSMCKRWDDRGMSPVHIAAINGQIEVLEELIRRDPSSAMVPVWKKVSGMNYETVLHKCVKHGQLRALQVLMEMMGDDDRLVYAEDEYGDTILHAAVRYRQVEIVRYLVENNVVDKHSRNSKGKTTLQILSESPPDATSSEIKKIVKNVKVLSSERNELANRTYRPQLRKLFYMHMMTLWSMIIAVQILSVVVVA